MKIDVRIRGLGSSEQLREHAVRRAHLHLSRFSGQVGSVSIHLSDVNGPKGGPDKRCQVMVRSTPIGTVSIDALNADAHCALDAAIERAARTVGREIERARESRRAHAEWGRAS
jgi:putative sigma-54 modulation protein